MFQSLWTRVRAFLSLSLLILSVLPVSAHADDGGPPVIIIGPGRPGMFGPPPGLEKLKYADWQNRDRNAQRSIFLVAGGSDSANFAQEIIEQRRHFLKLGVPESEIVCFYVRPSAREFMGDRKQFLSLADDLKNCYPANPKLVFEVLEESGLAGTSRLYYYSSSHGVPPMSYMMKKKMLSRPLAAQAEDWLNQMPFVDQYQAVYDADEKGRPVDFFSRFFRYEEGTRARDIMFTPRHFKEVLTRFWKPETQKVAVIQACYSGGFIKGVEEKYEKDTLSDVENIVVMTASKEDRGSFGCESGAETTYFGGEYNAEFLATASLEAVEWDKLYERVRVRVEKKESDYRASLPFLSRMSFVPSMPQFLSTKIAMFDETPEGAGAEFDLIPEPDSF